MLNIKIGDSYNYYHDGKIKESRKYTVVITDIIVFNDIDLDTLNLWKDEVISCYWLYSKETDYFIKGLLNIGYKNKQEEVYFVRTIDNTWFSIGEYCGRLDFDNTLSSKMYEYLYNSVVSEKGRVLNHLLEENKELKELLIIKDKELEEANKRIFEKMFK